MSELKTKCGYIGLVGRPNVGKSTLLNALLGQKLCITSSKPQTTRHRILGIHTDGDCQMVFVDTPGIHTQQVKTLNRVMNRTSLEVVKEVDILVWVVEGTKWLDDDEYVLKQVARRSEGCKLLVAINKIDLVKNKNELLPHMEYLHQVSQADALIPICALESEGLDTLMGELESALPKSDFYYDKDLFTDRSQRFLVAEMVREKLIRQLGQEVPHGLAVEIESFKHEEGGICHIAVLILVEKPGQKPIVVGAKGAKLKRVGTDARRDVEALLGCKVMLNLWVKVKDNWSDDVRTLKSLGLDSI